MLKKEMTTLFKILIVILTFTMLNACYSHSKSNEGTVPVATDTTEHVNMVNDVEMEINTYREEKEDSTITVMLNQDKRECIRQMEIDAGYELNLDTLKRYTQLMRKNKDCVDNSYLLGKLVEYGDLIASLNLNKVDESHYSHSVELEVTDRQTGTVRTRLVLLEEYGNENYEKIITSTIKNREDIFIETVEYFGPRNQKGFMDADSKRKIKRDQYRIDREKGLELLSSQEERFNFE